MFTKICLLRVCDIHIDVCYLLYDMLSLLYIFYIELVLFLQARWTKQYYSSKNLQVYLCTFILNWLSLNFLGFFIYLVADITGI